MWEHSPEAFHDLTEEMVNWLVPRLDLDNTKLYFKVQSLKRGSADNETNVAYDVSNLRFDGQKIETEEELFSTVIHELLHTLMAPLYGHHLVTRKAQDKPMRRVLDESYRQADEQVTVRLERVLHRQLWPVWRDRNKPKSSSKKK